MSTTPITIEDFGGLTLNGDPQGASGRARDMKNLRLDRPGQMVTRGGFSTVQSTTQSGVVGFYRYRLRDGGGNDSMIAIQGAANTLRCYSSAWAVEDKTPVSGGTFSGGGVEFTGTFWASRTDATIAQLDQSDSLLGVNNTPRAYFLTLTGVEGRMVAANAMIAATPNPVRVYFSNPGNAGSTGWGANNFVDLPFPGQIRAAVNFRDNVFVFLDGAYVIFYGEGVDTSGNPIFLYRPVDVGVGCAYNFGAAVGPDGVYFISTDGIYRTSGDIPVLVSGDIQSIFDAATGTEWNGPTSIVTPRLYAANDRLYFINDAKVFSYHYGTQTWTFDTYSPSVQFIQGSRTEAARSIYFIDGTGKACEAGDTFTTDDGSAIAFSYTSGASDLGFPARVKTTLESQMVGYGTATLKVSTDYAAFDTGSAVTLGTSPAIATGWQQIDREGTLWQFQIAGTGAVRIDRLVHYLSFVKPVGVE